MGGRYVSIQSRCATSTIRGFAGGMQFVTLTPLRSCDIFYWFQAVWQPSRNATYYHVMDSWTHRWWLLLVDRCSSNNWLVWTSTPTCYQTRFFPFLPRLSESFALSLEVNNETILIWKTVRCLGFSRSRLTYWPIGQSERSVKIALWILVEEFKSIDLTNNNFESSRERYSVTE